jgi:hypothetical protein
VLPAGYVLAPRDDRHQTERTARKPSVRVAGGAAQALPARAAEKDAMALPEHVAESDPRALPERVVTSEVEVLPAREAVPEHIDDALPDALIDRASASVPDPPGDALPDRVAEGASSGTLHRGSHLARRFVARRVSLTAAIGACVLLLGALLDDGIRVEQAASEAQPPSEAPGLTARSAPVPLAGPEAAVPGQSEALSHAGSIVETPRTRKHVDTKRSRRDGGRRRDGRTGPVWMRRKLAPITSEPPAWGTP